MNCLLKLLATITVLILSYAGGRAASVTVEAESGVLGADYAITNDGTAEYIAIQTDYLDLNSPGSSNRVATYSLNFPAAGTYNLYARVRVGPGGGTDDSFFYGNGFGVKSPTNSNDWNTVNNLATPSGFTNHTDTVVGDGTAGNQVWKWLNLSQFTNSVTDSPITFTVTASNLVQTFQIGARENGLDIDKFVFGTASYTFTVADLDAGGPGTPPPAPKPGDLVSGNLIQFSDNGAWCWYQDERAAVDRNNGNLIVVQDCGGAGFGGSPRNSEIDAEIFNFASGMSRRFVIMTNGEHGLGCDDHNTPGLLVMTNGQYLAAWSGHNNDNFSYWRIYNPDTGVWNAEQGFDWNTQPGGTSFPSTYNNLHWLPAEGRIYDFSRGNQKSPNFIISTNQGASWNYGGLLTTNGNVGYVNGYFRYADDSVNDNHSATRIDFLATEYHPRDYDTSIYHGYISNGMAFKSDGTVVDSNIFDQAAATPQSFTPVFLAGTVVPPGQTNHRCWNDDVQRYPDGTIEGIISARINDNTQDNDDNINPDHAFFFCRYDGTHWTSTYLCQAGVKLWSSEADYVGLGCLAPNDPNTIFVSTAFDPRAVQPGVYDTNQPVSSSREIWKGVTTNHGASFFWTPITQNSTRDNLRPIVPAWDAGHVALLWFRGTYFSQVSFDAAVVGIVDGRAETVGQMHYVDATTNNTFLTNGAVLVLSSAANQWHLQTGSGNNGTILSSADSTGETPPPIMTRVTMPGPGTYDLWVNFWGNPAADWRIAAGLTATNRQTYRSEKCQQVQPWTQDASLVFTNTTPENNFLYQAYLGRVAISNNDVVSVFVNGDAIQTGGDGATLIGDTSRTWYDGISYAKVEPFQFKNVSRTGPSSVTLTWNSPPPEMPLTTPSYTVQKKNALTDASWITLTNGMPSAGYTTTFTDASASGNTAFYRVSWP